MNTTKHQTPKTIKTFKTIDDLVIYTQSIGIDSGDRAIELTLSKLK